MEMRAPFGRGQGKDQRKGRGLRVAPFEDQVASVRPRQLARQA